MYYIDEEERRKRLQQQMQQQGSQTGFAQSSVGQAPKQEMSFHDEFKRNLQLAGLLGEEKSMTGPLGNISYYEEATPRSREEYQSLVAQANNPQQQTPIPTLGQQAPQQTPVPNMGESLGIDAQEQIKQNNLGYEQKYNAANPFWTGIKNMNFSDWKEVGKDSLLGVEKALDSTTLGGYALANKHLGGNYQDRNKEYQRQAQDAGIGNYAKTYDRLVDTVGSTVGPGKITGNIFKSFNKAVRPMFTDVFNSGVTNANRSGEPGDIEKWGEGMIDSNTVQIAEYLKMLGFL